jgi:Domain of unknown function (DUF1906)
MWMRRVATFVTVLACALTGVTICAAAPVAHDAGQTVADRAGAAAATLGNRRAKVVTFAGYALEVPLSWPVYLLAQDPGRCVRYDRNAVYLGQPGPDQRCPAHLVGRVATLSLQAPGQAALLPSSGNWQPVGPDWLGQGSAAPANPAQAATVVRQDAFDQAVWASFGGGLTATATYAHGTALIRAILGTIHRSGAGPDAAASAPAPVKQGGQHAGRRCHRRHHCCKHHRRCPRFWRFRLPVKGFDTCATPSLRAMAAWHHAFTAAAIYLGGPEAACGWGNLSAAWVKDAVHMGWALLPAYVGPQAPCTSFTVRIRPGSAEAQGRASARNAIGLARALRLGRHAPIYYDMEAYNDVLGVCRRAVLAFLDGWTRQLRARGYTSGVYSSAGAAARDLGTTGTIYGHRLAKPGSLWFALWDKHQNVQGWPYLLRHWWTGRHRVKQWMGAHRLRINGVRMNVDSDQVCGAVYRPRRRFEGCR